MLNGKSLETQIELRSVYLETVRILNAVDHIQGGTGGLEARMTQKELK